MDKRNIYLITGASGHLGTAIACELLGRGESVYGLFLPGEKVEETGILPRFGDVRDRDSIERILQSMDCKNTTVIHCAGIISIGSSFNQKMYDVNVNGTKNITDLCMKYQVKKLLYISSVHAIPERPHGTTITETKVFLPEMVKGPYAKTKAEATAYVLQKVEEGLNASIVHPSGIIGPYDDGKGHINSVILAYYNEKLIAGVHGGYDFVDVRDVANGVIAACLHGKAGECYILSNQYYSMETFFKKLHAITAKREIRLYLPIWLVKPIAYFLERIARSQKRQPLVISYSMYTLQSNSCFSHEKASMHLGYQTRDLGVSLSDTITWFRERGIIR